MLQVGPSGKTAERYTTSELYAFVNRAETGVVIRSELTSSTSNADSVRKRESQVERSKYTLMSRVGTPRTPTVTQIYNYVTKSLT